MIGYAIAVSFCTSVSDWSWAYGASKNTHDSVPTPTAMIRESIRLARSRPGLRRRTSIRTPAIRKG